MSYARGLAAFLALLLGASTSWGQYLWGPPHGGGHASTIGGGLGFNKGHGNKSLSFYLKGSYTRYSGYGFSGFGPYHGGYGFGPPPITSFSIITPPPVQQPPIIIVQPPAPPPEPEIVFVEVGRRPDPMPPPDPPLPGEAAGKFRPVGPGDREKARRPAPDAKPDPKKPKEDRPPPPLPMPPPPDPDPNVEYQRLIAMGKEAFAVQERGRALHRFRQAVALRPGDPEGQRLLALTLFSLGKYTDAVEAIQTGMRLDPNWENVRFRPLELYGPNPADWPENLQALEEALKGEPENPALLFLYAHQLWLDGRQDEAIPFFQKAARFAPEKDRPFINRFLKARPPRAPVV